MAAENIWRASAAYGMAALAKASSAGRNGMAQSAGNAASAAINENHRKPA